MGCGTGYYSNRIAETGATVLGVDPSESYINTARQNAAGKVSFETRKVGYEGALDFIPSDSVDYVYMSDALLFYFTPALPNDTASLDILLRDIRRILKPGASFISVEPHFLFWLAPWLGDPDRPFTVINEYHDRKFGVAPNLSRFVQACAKGGFAVTWIEELYPDPDFESIDPRAYYFAREFPLWQLFEMKKIQ
jgi:SAM-dependent methyltransferase